MQNNWKKSSLGDLQRKGLAHIQTGPFGTVLKASEYSGHGVPVISVGEIREGYLKVSEHTPKVSSETVSRLPQFTLMAGDIVFGRKGAINRNSIVNQQQSGWFLGSDGIRLRLSPKINSVFVSYTFRTNAVGKWLLQNSSGSIMPSLNQKTLDRLPVWLPEKYVQDAIASLLSSIDRKIELNNCINAELEATAKAFYDYWFVQFDFPDANGMPYKSSGGKMAYNATLKREVPQGWELVPIEYFADVIDPHPSHRAPKEVCDGYPFAGIGDIDEAGNISISKARKIDEEFVLKQERDYEIGEYSLGYGRVGTVGKVVRLKKQKFRYALSPTLSVINPKKPEYAGYVYTVVKSEEFFRQVLKNTSGTTRPAIGIQFLRKIPVLRPANFHMAMFERFEEITKEIFEKTSITNQESQNLIELRNWLLPMLMNGQVIVR